MSTGKALLHLAQHPELYDVKVVAALAEVIAADDGVDEAAMLAEHKDDPTPVAAA